MMTLKRQGGDLFTSPYHAEQTEPCDRKILW